MDTENIYKFELDITPNFLYKVRMTRVSTNRGDVFIGWSDDDEDKNTVYFNFVNIDNKDYLSIKISGLFFHFSIISGDISTLVGDYEIEIFGFRGKMRITSLPMENIL